MSATPDFAMIHDTYRPRVLRYLTRLAGVDDAEDLTQEVFAKLSRALQDFRGESELSTWIYRIATNVVNDRFRHASSQGACGIDDESTMEDLPDTKPSAERQIIHGQMSNCIRGMVNTLPESYRAVIILSELDEFRDAEVAGILGISIEAVKIRLHRARQLLRKKLNNQCSMYRDEDNRVACLPKSDEI